VDQRFSFNAKQRNREISFGLTYLCLFTAYFILIHFRQEAKYAALISTCVVATGEISFYILSRRNEAIWLRENELQVTNWLGRVKKRIPYATIESFRNDSIQPRYEFFALISDRGKVRIPGEMPGIAQLSREIRLRRYGTDEPHYPQWIDTDPKRQVTPPSAYTYAVQPVAMGLATLLGIEFSREVGSLVFMFLAGISGIVGVAISSSDALQRFKRDREERFEEIVEW